MKSETIFYVFTSALRMLQKIMMKMLLEICVSYSVVNVTFTFIGMDSGGQPL